MEQILCIPELATNSLHVPTTSNVTDTQMVTISSSTHHDWLVKQLWSFYESQRGVDFDLEIDGRTIRTHRLLTEAFLPIGEEEQEQNVHPTSRSKGIPISGSPSGGDGGILDAFVQFLYTGTAVVRADQLGNLMTVARALNFKMLIGAVGLATEKYRKEEPLRININVNRGAPDGGNVQRQDCANQKSTAGEVVLDRTESASDAAVNLDRVVLDGDKTQQPDRPKLETSTRPDRVRQPSNVAPRNIPRKRKQLEFDKLTRARIAKIVGSDRVYRKVVRVEERDESDERYSCEQCDFKTGDLLDLTVHRASHVTDARKHQCQTCGKKMREEHLLAGHVCRPAKTAALNCPHCDYSCRNRNRFVAHLAECHDDKSVELFKCSECFKTFCSRRTLETHQRAHRVYRCAHCNFETKIDRHYIKHLAAAHRLTPKGKPVAMQTCTLCEFESLCKVKMLVHMSNKHGWEKPYKCPRPGCSYSTAHKNFMPVHIRRAHFNVKPSMCEVCGARCASRSALDKHKLSHVNDRPLTCDICSKKFKYKCVLDLHKIRSHAYKMPYQCRVCKKSYPKKHLLKGHLKKAHDIEMTFEDGVRLDGVKTS